MSRPNWVSESNVRPTGDQEVAAPAIIFREH